MRDTKHTNINRIETIPERVGPVGVGDCVRHGSGSGSDYLLLLDIVKVSKTDDIEAK
jgi:hypothetical protein